MLWEKENTKGTTTVFALLSLAAYHKLSFIQIRKAPSTRANDALYPGFKSSKHALQPLDRSVQKALFIHPATSNQPPKVVYIITTNTSRDSCQLQQATPIIMYEDKWKIITRVLVEINWNIASG